jgi:dethiobiotin synthetase
MPHILVAGIGTDVGKTITSAILTLLLQADYWKPVECGASDTALLQKWGCSTHAPAYAFNTPLSPHHAARLEKRVIENEKITLPLSHRPLIIESVGGIFVPLNQQTLTIDLFEKWPCEWVIVSRHYVGSINHTLLTLTALKERKIAVRGIIFNGTANPDSESLICSMTQTRCLGRLLPEEDLSRSVLEKYATKWALCF